MGVDRNELHTIRTLNSSSSCTHRLVSVAATSAFIFKKGMSPYAFIREKLPAWLTGPARAIPTAVTHCKTAATSRTDGLTTLQKCDTLSIKRDEGKDI